VVGPPQQKRSSLGGSIKFVAPRTTYLPKEHQMRTVPLAALSALTLGCTETASPPGPPLLEFVVPPPARMVPGQRVPDSVVVRARDAEGRLIAGLPLVWSGLGTITPLADTTDAHGEAAARWTLPRLLPLTGGYAGDADRLGTAGPTGSLTLRVTTGDAPAITATVDVDVLRVERLDAGFYQACGVAAGTLWCWGSGLYRLLLVPGSDTATRPLQIMAVPNAVDAAVSDEGLCILNAAGAVRCSALASGRGFVPVQGAPSLRDLEDAGALFCGRSADSTAWCWATTGAAAFTARQASAELRFAQLAGGQSGFVCGRTATGAAWCWGRNSEGQLGDGTTDSSVTPVAVSGALAFRDVAASGSGACGIARDESIWCWGTYVVPVGSRVPVPVRVTVPPGPWTRLAGGWLEHYALGTGTTWSWLGPDDNVPDPLTEALVLQDFSAEDGQKCVVVAGSGEVFCSWILVYGGGDTSLYPSALVPVPAP
jgi:hypothetical protein